MKTTRKTIQVITLCPDGYETDNREFDTLKDARRWVKESGLNADRWNRAAESETDYHGWMKRNVAKLQLMVNGEVEQEWTPEWAVKPSVDRVLTIQLEDNDNAGDGHDDETIIERVLELVREGYTSGFEPTWSISETAA